MYSITVTNQTTASNVTQSQTANYTSDEPPSLDQVGIVCEFLCGMVMPEYGEEQE